MVWKTIISPTTSGNPQKSLLVFEANGFAASGLQLEPTFVPCSQILFCFDFFVSATRDCDVIFAWLSLPYSRQVQLAVRGDGEPVRVLPRGGRHDLPVGGQRSHSEAHLPEGTNQVQSGTYPAPPPGFPPIREFREKSELFQVRENRGFQPQSGRKKCLVML